jgi:hypothetical protein
MSTNPKQSAWYGPLLTVRQFASDANVTSSCVRKWLVFGIIASIKLGRLVRIPASERDRLFREGLRLSRREGEGGSGSVGGKRTLGAEPKNVARRGTGVDRGQS